MLAVAAQQPLFLIVEDLYWADPSTIELIDFLFGQVPAAPVLVLITSRPEFRPPWTARGHFRYLTVNRVPFWRDLGAGGSSPKRYEHSALQVSASS
jgi:predicted ATPase